MKLRAFLSALCALALGVSPAFAASDFHPTRDSTSNAIDSTGTTVIVDPATGLPTGSAARPLYTTPGGGTQDVNVAQVAGATVKTGNGTASGALRVALPTDGTGVVGLIAGSAIVGKVGIDQTTPGTTNGVVVNSSALPTGAATETSVASTATNTGSGGVLAYAAGVSTSYTRPNDTTAYAVNDAWSDSTSAPTYLTFSNVCRANGKTVILTDLLVVDGANQTTKLTGNLFLFDTAPTAVNDNSAFNVSSGDSANLKAVIPFSPAYVGNTSSGSSGWTSDEQTSLGRQLTCAGGSRTIYGLVQVTNAYTPVAQEVLSFRVRVIGVD